MDNGYVANAWFEKIHLLYDVSCRFEDIYDYEEFKVTEEKLKNYWVYTVLPKNIPNLSFQLTSDEILTENIRYKIFEQSLKGVTSYQQIKERLSDINSEYISSAGYDWFVFNHCSIPYRIKYKAVFFLVKINGNDIVYSFDSDELRSCLDTTDGSKIGYDICEDKFILYHKESGIQLLMCTDFFVENSEINFYALRDFLITAVEEGLREAVRDYNIPFGSEKVYLHHGRSK